MDFFRATDVVAIVLVGVLVELFRRFGSPQQFPVTAEWIDELSVERYRPMLRLLNQEDVHFLRIQPGFTKQMATKIRLQRCQVFQEYLRHLDNDFKRICSALKVLMVQSKQDRPDLASLLLRNQITFAYGMIMVQARLVCYRYGIGTMDVSGLVKLFDGMRIELRTLVQAELGTGA
jgi:tRNA/tmRNA/rRNA uracil-C5-methylase (TrmA/RlmC/RlmD family)